MVDSSPSAPSSPPLTNLSRKRYRSYAPKDDKDNITVESACTGGTFAKDSCTPSAGINPLLLPSSKHHHADTASRTITAWRKVHEINVLKAILEYYDVIGEYPFDNESHMQKFYKDWIGWRGVYVDQDLFTNKLVELLERFFENKKIMDHYDAEIYHLSHLIWGLEDDSEDANECESSAS